MDRQSQSYHDTFKLLRELMSLPGIDTQVKHTWPDVHFSPIKQKRTERRTRKLKIIYEEDKENKKMFEPLNITRQKISTAGGYPNFELVFSKVEIYPKIKVTVEIENQPQLQLQLSDDGNNLIEAVKNELISRGIMRADDAFSSIKFGRCPRFTLDRKWINLPPGYHVETHAEENDVDVVSQLRIWNQHGSVRWNGSIKIKQVDFSDFVEISSQTVNFKWLLPVPCLVTLYRCYIQQPMLRSSSLDVQQQLKRYCQRRKAKFVSFDEQSGHWSFLIDPSNN